MTSFVLKIGDIVESRAGHDIGRAYVVMRIENEFCYVVDGEYRGVDNPKKKRIKHLKYAFKTPKTTDSQIKQPKGLGDLTKNPTDADIKRIIKEWRAYAERR